MNWLWKLTDRLGKFLGFDATYFVKSSFWVSFKNGVGMVTGFFLSIAFARLVSKQIYGEYTFILSTMYLLTFLSVPRFNFALSQAATRGYDQALYQATRISLWGSLLATVILLSIGGRYFYLGDPNLGYSFIWVAVFFPLLFGLKTYDYFLTGKKRFDRSAQFAAVSSILTGIVLVTAMIISQRVVELILGYLLVNGGLNLVFFRWTKKLVKNKRYDPGVVKYGIYLTGLSLAAILVSRFGQVFVNQFRGAESLAIYAIAMVIPSAIQNQLQNLVDVAKVKVTDRNRLGLMKVVRKHAVKWLILGIGVAVGLWLILPIAIPLIYSNKYNEAVRYAQVASLALAVWPLNTFLGTLVMLEKKPKIVGLSHFIPSVPNLVLLPMAIWYWGIWGAVGINLLANLYMVPFNLWAFWRKKDL